jgi:NAD(P)-dependent dehydrogenase (short-subunit alcohol dehydrogenase family)
VEILSTLEEKMPHLPSISPDMIGTLKTLGQISEYLSESTTVKIAKEESQPEKASALSVVERHEDLHLKNSTQLSNESGTATIPRNVVKVIDAPTNFETPVTIAEDKTIFVTDDNTELSKAVTEQLIDLGLNAVKISLDITKNEEPLRNAAGLVIIQNHASDKIERDLKQAFILTQHVAPDLIGSASDGGAVFATITRLDGAFGFKQTSLNRPEQGGLAGLAKTAAIEWKDVHCRAIDIAPDWKDNQKIAAMVVKEILSSGPLEIGLQADRRCTLSIQEEPYPVGQIDINTNDVIIISGGARGITAASALALAKQSGPTLILLGRSPSPTAEPNWLSSIEGEASLKAAILKNEFNDKSASPKQLESAYRSYVANREILANLSKLKSAGANVYYYSVDIREFEAVRAIVDDIHSVHGPITGMIHGAGVLEDRLIIDKTIEQFERVFDTKVGGLKNLLKATREAPLKHIVIFSSVSARLGNKGQVDYAMANEVLNKMAQLEAARRSDCYIKAINWGPWDGGMVSSAVKREFERNGVPLIAMDDGVQCLLHEMKVEKNSPVEVVIGAQIPSNKAKAHQGFKRPTLVQSKHMTANQKLSLAFEREIDIKNYPVLKSHIIDGRPVVPLALIIEWFAHGALHESPGLVLHGLDDIRIMKGIRLDHEKKYVRLLAGKPTKNDEFYEIAVELGNGKKDGKAIIHAKANAILADQMPHAPGYQFSKAMVASAYTRKIADVYDKILFHGMQLHGIYKIISCSSRGMVAHIRPAPSPTEWMTAPLRNQWIADPLVLDSAFQMATVWCFEEKGEVSLPSYAASYRQYRQEFPADRVTVVLEVRDVTDRKMKGDFTFLDTNGDIVACLTGYEAIMDASLLKAFKPHYKASA